jgi:hypothetical protein
MSVTAIIKSSARNVDSNVNAFLYDAGRSESEYQCSKSKRR